MSKPFVTRGLYTLKRGKYHPGHLYAWEIGVEPRISPKDNISITRHRMHVLGMRFLLSKMSIQYIFDVVFVGCPLRILMAPNSR